MTRKLDDWLTSYIHYTRGTEAPKIMHFYGGVSAIAGALRRKVWIDMSRFKWYPSFYIVFVADPGIVAKSSTADLAMDLLKSVPGIKFGPNSVTWQSLVTSFAGACESFEWNGDWHPMSAITLVASEFGSLMDLKDQGTINLFIELWDGRASYEKQTKMSGSDVIEAPWINLLACTTPSWIATNMSALAASGGLTSRTIYVFAQGKENFVPYPDEAAPEGNAQLREDLIEDLGHIATALAGPVTLSAGAREWGREWYKNLWEKEYKPDKEDWAKGYLSRKQTHMHKLAMVLNVSRGDSLCIEAEDLMLADQMLRSIETDLDRVFQNIGRSDDALNTAKFIDTLRRRKEMPYAEAYQLLGASFPDAHELEGILQGVLRSGYASLQTRGDGMWFVALGV